MQAEHIDMQVGTPYTCGMELTNIGLYTPQQASALTKATTAEVSRWLFGYKMRNGETAPALWKTQIRDTESKVIGFRDLMELRIVSTFVRHGVSLRVIRQALENARAIFKTEYPFTSKRFLTDGKFIYHEALESEGNQLTDLRKRQQVFSSIIKPSLYDCVDFSDKGAAIRWYPTKDRIIMLDPGLSFGRPVLAREGIPTEAIYLAYKAEHDDAKAVAAQYDIALSEVKKAVAYETGLLAA